MSTVRPRKSIVRAARSPFLINAAPIVTAPAASTVCCLEVIPDRRSKLAAKRAGMPFLRFHLLIASGEAGTIGRHAARATVSG